MSVHEDTLQGLQEILDYVKGDKSKGRTVTVELSDEKLEKRQLLWRKINALSDAEQEKVDVFVDELKHA
ncbi:MAG: hypothetical protein FWG38_11705 [Defluviitaleaceae bacterium]|nr:hypothetical protein [Defluviitaleaceae bacterium]